MVDAPYVYWRRKEDADVSTCSGISGWCRLDDVPSYGEVGTLRPPTAIETRTDSNGVKTITSPPIVGPSHAYRYCMTLRESHLDEIAQMEDPMLDSYLRVVTTESPVPGADRANWWWYAHDRFRYVWTSYTKTTKIPTRLMTTWKRGMLEILLAKHPHKDRHLEAWDGRVEGHKNAVARKRAAKTPHHRKSHGDLVVLPFASQFKSGATHQIFRYHIEDSSYPQKRKKHSLRVHDTRCIVPHGQAMTFADGTAPHDGLLPPIRTAMALLAWSCAPKDTAHQRLRANARFSTLLEQTLQEMEAWLTDPARMGNVHRTQCAVEAARSALRCFLSPPTDPEKLDVVEQAIESHAKAVRRRLQEADELCQALIGQEEDVSA